MMWPQCIPSARCVCPGSPRRFTGDTLGHEHSVRSLCHMHSLFTPMAIFGMYAPAVRDSPSNKYPVNALNTGCMKSGMHERKARLIWLNELTTPLFISARLEHLKLGCMKIADMNIFRKVRSLWKCFSAQWIANSKVPLIVVKYCL